jgi:tRNA pseudouridine38-40 synthase
MARIKLIVAYEGTAYVGWQYQPNGLSVQQCLEQALAQLTGQVHTLHSSGRTDAGVHALGMVCHFSSERQLPIKAWREGLNRFLPPDIIVRDAAIVGDDFHARFNACGKHYRYSILRDPIRRPLERRTSWQLKYVLDLEQMRVAARQFVGRHDFSAFRTSGCSAETTVREIFSVDLVEEGALLHIDVRGGGFLRNMVRMMVGTLVEIGRGKRPPESIAALLRDADSASRAVTAPAHGLCLIEVCY